MESTLRKPNEQSTHGLRLLVLYLASGLLVLATMASTPITAVASAALYMTLAISSGVFWGYIALTRFRKEAAWITISSVLLMTVYISGLVLHSTDGGTAYFVVAMVIGTLSFFLLASYLRWDDRAVLAMFPVAAIFIAVHFFWWLASDKSNDFSGFYLNPNSLAVVVFILSFFCFAAFYKSTGPVRWLALASVVLAFAVVYATNARGSLISLSLVALLALLGPVLSRRKWLLTVIFAVTLAGLCLFVLVYPTLISNGTIANQWNEVSLQATGKSFFSGRHILWMVAFQGIAEQPVFGYGPGFRLSEFTGIDLSAHNLYLQTTLQTGILGLIALLAVLVAVFFTLLKNPQEPVVYLSLCFLVSKVIQEGFEVTLTQNNVSVGFLAWLIFGIGVSRALAHINSENGLRKVNSERR